MALDLINSAKKFLAKSGAGTIANALVGTISPVSQPQLAYSWEVSIISPYLNNTSIMYYAKSISIPSLQTETIKRNFNGVPYTYTGKDTSPRMFRATFYDNQNQSVYRYFYKWFKLQNNGIDRNKYGTIDQFQTIEVKLKDSSDAAVTGKFVMTNSRVLEISDIALSYNESNEITFDVIFGFDLIEVVDETN